MAKARKKVLTAPSAPLFAYLAFERITPSDFARKINSTPQVLTNWKNRKAIPLTALPVVVKAMGLTVDEYMAPVGKAMLSKQTTLEAAALLADYEKLPDGLKEVVARKAAELRVFVDALPSIYLDAFRRAPTDPARYRAWEQEIEAAIAQTKTAKVKAATK